MERNRLDVSADISTLLNFAIDDIKDFSARSTTWSKTIVLPGTQNNNKLFGHIFQIGQSNQFVDGLDNVGYNYNASKAADCIIFQDQMQTFKGVLRLMQINITRGEIEYEVAVFGELAGLSVSLSGGLLENLDFSAYNHTYNAANIVASWANTSGVNIYYPLIDYGTYSTLKADWDIRTFRPALHVYEYLDKMFTAAGFRWSSSLLNTARFKSLIIPYNRKLLTSFGSAANASGISNTNPIFEGTLFTFEMNTIYTTFTSSVFAHTGGGAYEYQGSVPATFRIRGTITGTATDLQTLYVRDSVPTETATIPIGGGTNTPWSYSFDYTIIFQPGEWYYTNFIVHPDDELTTYEVSLLTGTLLITGETATGVEIAPGGEVIMNDTIPRNVSQIDFLLGIIKLFNLYLYEDRLDSRLIYLTP